MTSGMIEMFDLLDLNGCDHDSELFVASGEEMQLLLKMPMYGLFNRLGARHDRIASHQGCYQAKNTAADPPQGHGRAGAGLTHWHGIAELSAMGNLMRQRFLQEGYEVGGSPAGDAELGSVNANGTVLPGVIDLQDAPNGAALLRRQDAGSGGRG